MTSCLLKPGENLYFDNNEEQYHRICISLVNTSAGLNWLGKTSNIPRYNHVNRVSKHLVDDFSSSEKY